MTALLLMSMGCSGEASTGNRSAAEPATNSAGAAGSAKAAIGDDQQTGESDRIALRSAEAACQSRDPNAFFDAFIQSKAVQQKYSATSIEYVKLRSDFTVDSWTEVKASDYTGFPIEMVDYYRKPTAPLNPGADEHVVIELNQGQNEAFVVEWTRVTYDGKSSGGDDLGTAFTLDGKPYKAGEPTTDGQLFFAATPDCWQLETDTRHHRNNQEK